MSKVKNFLVAMNDCSKSVKKETPKPMVWIWISMLYSFVRFGSSPGNYYKFKFYEMTNKQRATFVTRKHHIHLMNKYNSSSNKAIFNDKVLFAKAFEQFMGRSWIDPKTCSEEEWSVFAKDKDKVICKPVDGSQGMGIQVISTQEYSYEDIKEKFSGYIVEELIQQHHKIDEIYDKAVNCLRVITITKDNKVNLLVSNYTFGSEFEIVNASYGGVVTQVDVETGIIFSTGGGFDRKVYEKHPCSNVTLKGFEIPYWKEIVEMVTMAAKVVPEIGYVGWDIAITENGPVIIEGNTKPGYSYFQIPELLKQPKTGVLSKYEPFL